MSWEQAARGAKRKISVLMEYGKAFKLHHCQRSGELDHFFCHSRCLAKEVLGSHTFPVPGLLLLVLPHVCQSYVLVNFTFIITDSGRWVHVGVRGKDIQQRNETWPPPQSIQNLIWWVNWVPQRCACKVNPSLGPRWTNRLRRVTATNLSSVCGCSGVSCCLYPFVTSGNAWLTAFGLLPLKQVPQTHSMSSTCGIGTKRDVSWSRGDENLLLCVCQTCLKWKAVISHEILTDPVSIVN